MAGITNNLRKWCFAALAASVSFPAFAQEGNPLVRPSGLAIHGRGSYEVTPERLTIQGTLTTVGDTEDEAVTPHFEEAARVKQVIEGLVANGLVLKRSRYGLRSDQPLRYNDSPNITAEEKLREEYYATTTYSFLIEDLKAAPEIVSALARSAIHLSQMEYDVKDDRAALLEARKLAALDAASQAKAYAEAFGIKLVSIRSITDGEARPEDGAADLIMDTSAQLTIQVPETISFWSSVDVVWDIAPEAP